MFFWWWQNMCHFWVIVEHINFNLGHWLIITWTDHGSLFQKTFTCVWNYVFLPEDENTDFTNRSDFENESPPYGGIWLAEFVIPVCPSFLSRGMVRRWEPMGEQRWGCNCDPGKNSPLFLGRRRSVTSLLPALPDRPLRHTEELGSPLTSKMWDCGAHSFHHICFINSRYCYF